MPGGSPGGKPQGRYGRRSGPQARRCFASPKRAKPACPPPGGGRPAARILPLAGAGCRRGAAPPAGTAGSAACGRSGGGAAGGCAPGLPPAGGCRGRSKAEDGKNDKAGQSSSGGNGAAFQIGGAQGADLGGVGRGRNAAAAPAPLRGPAGDDGLPAKNGRRPDRNGGGTAHPPDLPNRRKHRCHHPAGLRRKRQHPALFAAGGGGHGNKRRFYRERAAAAASRQGAAGGDGAERRHRRGAAGAVGNSGDRNADARGFPPARKGELAVCQRATAGAAAAGG